MRSSSIFDFFARLVMRRGHFRSVIHLREFPFPHGMIAAESSDHFPDLVLKVYQNGDLSGGEFIACLDSDSYDIASFGSVPTDSQETIG